jgi:hypothetical protein
MVIVKPLKVKKSTKSIAKEEKKETASERQFRLAQTLKNGNSYDDKKAAFNKRLATTTEFNDIPKMKT